MRLHSPPTENLHAYHGRNTSQLPSFRELEPSGNAITHLRTSGTGTSSHRCRTALPIAVALHADAYALRPCALQCGPPEGFAPHTDDQSLPSSQPRHEQRRDFKKHLQLQHENGYAQSREQTAPLLPGFMMLIFHRKSTCSSRC